MDKPHQYSRTHPIIKHIQNMMLTDNNCHIDAKGGHTDRAATFVISPERLASQK